MDLRTGLMGNFFPTPCCKPIKQSEETDCQIPPFVGRERGRESMASNNTAMISKIASIAGTAMLVRSIVNVFFPRPFHHFLLSRVWHFFSRLSMVVEQYNGFAVDRFYEAAEVYLSTKISPSNTRLKVGKPDKEKGFLVTMDMDEEIHSTGFFMMPTLKF